MNRMNFSGDESKKTIMATDNKTIVEYKNFMGTGVSTFKILWWGLGAIMILFVAKQGVKLYKEIKQ